MFIFLLLKTCWSFSEFSRANMVKFFKMVSETDWMKIVSVNNTLPLITTVGRIMFKICIFNAECWLQCPYDAAQTSTKSRETRLCESPIPLDKICKNSETRGKKVTHNGRRQFSARSWAAFPFQMLWRQRKPIPSAQIYILPIVYSCEGHLWN